jgi:hypothetical protein
LQKMFLLVVANLLLTIIFNLCDEVVSMLIQCKCPMTSGGSFVVLHMPLNVNFGQYRSECVLFEIWYDG